MRSIAPVLITLLLPAAALAQSPPRDQLLGDLARTLGEAHGLRQTCLGLADQHWRDRMIAMVETETPEPDVEARLIAAFNAGFHEAGRLYPFCDDMQRLAEMRAIERGRSLAQTLSAPKSDAP
jgi:uncharacterized protein (TIGR02301 family)